MNPGSTPGLETGKVCSHYKSLEAHEFLKVGKYKNDYFFHPDLTGAQARKTCKTLLTKHSVSPNVSLDDILAQAIDKNK